MSFQFSLQRLLNLQERLEQEAGIELARLHTLVSEAKHKLREQEKQREQQLAAWRERIQGDLDVNELELHHRWLAVLDEAIMRQEMAIEELQTAVEEQRAEYLTLRRKRETLDKLRENEYSKFQKDLLKREQRELDDIASTRFVRREALTP
ncbi:MAG: flagellar export protein FliJ [Firmicutes bacterium]|nr:flagellar export protein FliJ [Bacillota bacterium]